MASDQQTKYTVYLGRAAADLDPSGTSLAVIVPELVPAALSGTFAPGTTKAQVSLNTLAGGTISATPTTANHIVAIWEGTSNHAYPPYIKKGEQVEVVRYGDSDRYYWRERGRDRELRQLDRLRLEVSATPAKNTKKDDTNTYFIEMDAVMGRIQIRTAKANQEPYAYAVTIDTKNGTVVISDDIKPTPNRIYMESGKGGATPKVMLNNAKNAAIELVGEDIIISAPRDIMVRAGRQIIETAPVATLNWNIGKISGTTLGVNSSESMVVTAPTFDVAGNVKITGMTVTQRMRSGSYYIGNLGSSVTAPTTTPGAGTGTVGGNTPDADVPADQRHAAAYEQVTTMAQNITNAFNEIQGKIGVPSVGTTITDPATASEMPNNAGI